MQVVLVETQITGNLCESVSNAKKEPLAPNIENNMKAIAKTRDCVPVAVDFSSVVLSMFLLLTVAQDSAGRRIQQRLCACFFFRYSVGRLETMASPPARVVVPCSREQDCLSILHCLLRRHTNQAIATVKKHKVSRYSVH